MSLHDPEILVSDHNDTIFIACELAHLVILKIEIFIHFNFFYIYNK